MKNAHYFITFITIVSASASAYSDRGLEDKIFNLPGTELLDIKFNQFSGYLSGNKFAY